MLQRLGFLALVLAVHADRAPLSDAIGTVIEGVAQTGFGYEHRRRAPTVSQPMKVIGAGFGRTGTMSLVIAFRALGLHSYHMKEGVLETPGHLVAWGKDLVAAASGSLPSPPKEAAKILDMIAAAGFNATADFPACLLVEEFMQRYPDALVVVSVRSDGATWAASVLGTIAQMGPLLQEVPWRWITFSNHFVKLNDWIFSAIGAPVDETTRLPRHEDLATAHDNWIDRMKSTVPAHKLLIHQARDGWVPLCKHLSPLDVTVRARCDAILASGEPYPHVNDTAELSRVISLFAAISLLTKASPFVVVGLLLLCACWRKRATKQHAKQRRGNDKSE